MKALRIHTFGGADVMHIEDVPAPRPQAGEVLVRVQAASVNPVDYKTREGKFSAIGRDRLPITLGRDIAGTVEDVGPEVQGFRKGDAIYAMLGPDRGAFAEYVVVKTSEAAPKPATLDYTQAAAVPLAALTAWQGLFDHGGLKAGQRVLIHGGAGGVGHFAVQFAKTKGATVIATVSGKDLEFTRKLGADQVIDYHSQRFEDLVRDVDMVFDLVAGETQRRSWAVLKPGGVLVSTLGQPDQGEAARHQVRGIGYMARPNAADLAEIAGLIDDGKVHPVVAEIFPFSAASEAETKLQTGHLHGKIVIRLAA